MKYIIFAFAVALTSTSFGQTIPHCNARRSVPRYYSQPDYSPRFIITDVGARTRAVQAAKRRRAEQLAESYKPQRILELREEKQYRRDRVHAYHAMKTQQVRQLNTLVDMQEVAKLLKEKYVGYEPKVSGVRYLQDPWSVQLDVKLGEKTVVCIVSLATRTVVEVA